MSVKQCREVVELRERLLMVLTAASFTVLTIAVASNCSKSIDVLLAELIKPYSSNAWYYASRLSDLDSSAAMLAIISAAEYLRKKRSAFKTIIPLLASFIASQALVIVLKVLIAVPRPTYVSEGILEAYSYPSGHSTRATVIAYTLFREYKLLRPALIAFVLLTCFSRIAVGAHWLTDVIGGVLLGILTTSLTKYIYLSFMHKST
ncbi:MAG: phosphatase PAP2 family protein [Desulfurococcaceae archaeon]